MSTYPVVTDFANRYGSLRLEIVTDFQPVSQIRGADVDAALKFDTETAEQIALITDNRRIQLSPPYPIRDGGWFLLVHDSCSTAAVARVASIAYTGDTPSEEIQRARTAPAL